MAKENNQRGKSTNKIVPITLFTFAGVILIAILLCLALNRGQRQVQTTDVGDSDATVPATTVSEATNEENIQNNEKNDAMFSAALSEEGDTIAVSTQYGKLVYPAAFSEVIQIQTETENGVSTLKFVGEIGDDKAELFDVCYGEAGGELIKQIQLEDGSKICLQDQA